MPVALLGRSLGKLRRELAEIRPLLADDVRLVPMRMEFRTHAFIESPIDATCVICGKGGHAQRTLLSAGGLWDRLARAFAPGPSPVLREKDLEALPAADFDALCPAHTIIVADSQIAYVEAFADWLFCFLHDLPRPAALDVLAGKRRGGKTFIMVACLLAAAIAVPVTRRLGKERAFVGWLVVAGYPEQREIHEDVGDVLRAPEGSALDTAAWVRRRPAPNNCYEFANGATIFIKSAHNAETLKQGRVDLIGLNELQKMDGEAVVHSAGNTIDLGGLVIGTANPPRKVRGAWLLDIKAAWEDGRGEAAAGPAAMDPVDGLPVVRWFTVEPDKNPYTNSAARRKFKILASLASPKLAAADASGEWNQINDVVCPKWDHTLVLDQVPPEWENCTGEVIRSMGLREYLRRPETYSSFGGLDFNKSPHMAAVRWECFRDPMRPGVVLFVAVACLTSNPEVDRGHTEKEFIGELYAAGWRPDETLFIGDPSGQWQSSEHRKRGGVKQGYSSFDLFRSPTQIELRGEVMDIEAWDIFAPTTWKLKDSKHYAHPRKIESIDDVNELMRSRRLYVLSSCAPLIEAFKKCSTKTHGPNSEHWHVFDASRYPIHRALNSIEPKKKPPSKGGSGRGARAITSRGFGGGGRGGGGKMFGG